MNVSTREARECRRLGHVLVRVGPYIICRSLWCVRIVVEVVR